MSVLEIHDLQVSVKLPEGALKPILAGVNLTVSLFCSDRAVWRVNSSPAAMGVPMTFCFGIKPPSGKMTSDT